MSTPPNGGTQLGDFYLLSGILDRTRAQFNAEIVSIVKQKVSEHLAESELNEKIRLEVERRVAKELQAVPQIVADLLPLQVEHAVALYLQARIEKAKIEQHNLVIRSMAKLKPEAKRKRK